MATPVFCCGAECGVIGTGTDAAGAYPHVKLANSVSDPVTFSTTTVRSGARSFRCQPTATNGKSSFRTNPLSSNAILVGRAYVRFATLPDQNAQIVAADGSGASLGAVAFRQSDSKLYTIDANTHPWTFSGTGVSVTTGVWYRIDFKYNNTAGTFDAQVDGTALTQKAGLANGPADQAEFGAVSDQVGITAGDIFVDDIILSQTAADYPFGSGFVNHFVPTSDGTHNVAGANDFERTLTGTDIINSTTTAFQLVDDVPMESGAGVDWINMVAPPNATDYVECVFGPAPGISTPTAGPRAVDIVTAYRQFDTTTGNMEVRINDNGTTNALYSATTVVGVTTIHYANKQYATAIAGGGAWTVTSGNGNFNNLRVRFGSPAALDAAPDQYFVCTMVEAEFAVVASTPSLVFKTNTPQIFSRKQIRNA